MKEDFMKKIFITGGTGFIGSHLVNALIKNNDIFITGNDLENKISSVTLLNCHLNGIDYSRLGKIDVCIHLAANNDTICFDKQEMFMANFHAPKELFNRILNDHDCKKIIYASSASVYGNGNVPFLEENKPDPLSVYAESKLAFDEWVLKNKFPAIGLRFSNVYGPCEDHKERRASLITKIIKDLQGDRIVNLFKYGEQKRDWVYVKDVIKLILICIKSNSNGIFNCGSGYATSFNDIVEITSNLILKIPKIKYIDCPLGNNFQKNTIMSLEKSSKLGYKPKYSIEKGIIDLVKTLL